MAVGVSVVFIVVGAMLRFVVGPATHRVLSVRTAGLVLLIAGVVGLLVSLAWLRARRPPPRL
jgi:hypothetical protein